MPLSDLSLEEKIYHCLVEFLDFIVLDLMARVLEDVEGFEIRQHFLKLIPMLDGRESILLAPNHNCRNRELR